MSAESKAAVALALLAVLAAASWWTLEPGRVRVLVLVLLGGFAARIVLLRLAAK